jgi:hypothetical protein
VRRCAHTFLLMVSAMATPVHGVFSLEVVPPEECKAVSGWTFPELVWNTQDDVEQGEILLKAWLAARPVNQASEGFGCTDAESDFLEQHIDGMFFCRR